MRFEFIESVDKDEKQCKFEHAKITIAKSIRLERR